MVIDETYFYGPLTVANLTEENMLAYIRAQVAKYEPEFLQKLLGYELYRDMQAGLLEVVIDSKWTDLLYGKEFTNRVGQLEMWRGLVSNPAGVIVGYKIPDDIQFETDVTVGIVSGQPSYRNAVLKNKRYRVIERVTGQLVPVSEYTAINDTDNDIYGFDLVGRNFNSNAFYTLQFIDPEPVTVAETVATTVKQSVIANYVYFHTSRDLQTQTQATGEKIIKAANSENETPIFKQVRAWNELVEICRECRRFLNANGLVYTQWKDPLMGMVWPYYRYRATSISHRSELFQAINELNL